MEIPQLLWDCLRPLPLLGGSIFANMNFPCTACAHCFKSSPSRPPGRAQIFLYNPPTQSCAASKTAGLQLGQTQHPTLAPREKGLPRAGLAHVHAVGTGASCVSSAHPSFPKRLPGPYHCSGPLAQGCSPHVTAGVPPVSPSRPGPASSSVV